MAAKYDRLIARAKAIGESDMDEAQRLLERAVRLDPRIRTGYAGLVKALIRRSDVQGAERVASAALARWPDWSDMLLNLATARYHQGDLPGARDDLLRYRRNVRLTEPEQYLGLIHHALGEDAAALEVLRGAVALSAGGDIGYHVRSWVALMRLCRDMGRTAEADDAAGAALRLYPSKPAWITSTVSKLLNRRDYPEWDRFRKKDGFAAALAAAPAGTAPPHPATYLLPQDRARLLADADAGRSGPVWITKQHDLFGGQGMALIEDPSAIPAEAEQIVQHYLTDPYLHEGLKGHLRCYLLITSVDPLRAWFWRDGLVRFAPARFERGPGWLSRMDMHITNTALHKGHPGIRFHKNPKIEDFGTVWGLAAFIARILPDDAAREALWTRLADTAGRLVATLTHDGLFARQAAGRRAWLPKLIGLDILLDADLNPWLIEIQRVPGQTGDGPVNTVNTRLFREVFEMTVGPLDAGSIQETAQAEAAYESAHRGQFMPV